MNLDTGTKRKTTFGAVRALLFAALAVVMTAAGCDKAPTAKYTSIALAPKTGMATTLAAGASLQLVATGTRSDGAGNENITSLGTWTSGASATATVSNAADSKGLVVAVAKNVTPVVVTFSYEGLTATYSLTVTDATIKSIAVEPQNIVLAVGAVQAVVATGIYSDGTQQILANATWTSSDPTIATVGLVSGQIKVTGVSAGGPVTVTAVSGDLSATTTVVITPAKLASVAVSVPAAGALFIGARTLASAVGTFSDGSTQALVSGCVWTTGDQAKATVSNEVATKGLVTAVAAGTTTVQVACTINGIVKNGTADLTISNASIASIAIAPKVGNAITSLAKGLTKQMAATATLSDMTTKDVSDMVTWASADPAKLAVSPAGLIEAKATSTNQPVIITAVLNGQQGNIGIIVTSAQVTAVTVTPATPSLAIGTRQQMKATAAYTDSTTVDVTNTVVWNSTTPGIASVSTQAPLGEVTAVAQGNTEVKATLNGIVGKTVVTVTAVALSRIDVTPANTVIAQGTKQQYTATGVFSDGTTQDLTTQVSWSATANTGITFDMVFLGRATAAMQGQTTITATGTVAGVTKIGTATLNVSNATLVSIAITPGTPTVVKGLTTQLIATGTYSSGPTQDITSLVTWNSATTSVATVSNTAGSIGVASGLLAGTSVITAQLGGIVSPNKTLTVSAATVKSIALSVDAPSLAKGTQKTLVATATLSDNSTSNVTTSASWSSSNDAIATVSNIGEVAGVAKGTVVITANAGGINGTLSLSVTDASLTSIVITPATPSALAKGLTQQFTATGTYSDASTQDITTLATWTIADTTKATVSNAVGTRGVVTAALAGSTTLTAAIGAVNNVVTITTVDPVLASIVISPAIPVIAQGTTQQFAAVGVYTDNSTQTLTNSVNWSMSDTAVATISNANGSNGLASGVSAGSVTVSAAYQGVTGTTTMVVSPASLVSIAVTPNNAPTVAVKGVTKQFTAVGTYTGGGTQDITSLVTWASSNQGVGTISNANGTRGVFTPVATGSTNVTAQLGLTVSPAVATSVSAATLVSISITPSSGGSNLAKGLTKDFIAMGIYTSGAPVDITATVTWASSATGVATVAQVTGTVTGVDKGDTNLTATLGGVTGTLLISVTDATLSSIVVTPNPASNLAKGLTRQFIATGTFSDSSTQDITSQVTWAVGSGSILSVSNTDGSRGLVTALLAGATTVSASKGLVSSLTVDQTVVAGSVSSVAVTSAGGTVLAVGGSTLTLVATATLSDASPSVITNTATWSSSDTNVVNVAAGVVTAVGPGFATITASSNSKSGTIIVNVTDATLVSIAVSPSSATVAKGATRQFTAIATYSDSNTLDVTTAVTWASSAAGVATVSNATGSKGLVTGAATSGTTNITAELNGISSPARVVTGTAASLVSIAVTPGVAVISKSGTQNFVATGTYSDGSTAVLTTTVTWSTSSFAVSIGANVGNAHSMGATGTYTIYADLGAIQGTASLVVKEATLTSITLAPAVSLPSVLYKGQTVQLVATGHYSDSSSADITSTVSWTSATPAAATVGNTAGIKGLVTGVAVGSTEITAALSGITSDIVTQTTGDASLVSIEIDQTGITTPMGVNVVFTATGTYSDGGTADVTDSVTWGTSNINVATISNAMNLHGHVTTVAAGGPINITAVLGAISAPVSHLTVTNPVLLSIAITPTTATKAAGATQQYAAVGTYSNGNTYIVTSVVIWASSNTTDVTISNLGLATVDAMATSANTSNITASFEGITSNTAVLTVQ